MEKENKSMLRQGFQVSIKELRDLADELDKERIGMIDKIGIDYPINKRFLVGIINKEPNCSDTWEFENGKGK